MLLASLLCIYLGQVAFSFSFNTKHSILSQRRPLSLGQKNAVSSLISLRLLSNKYLENDLVSIRIPEKLKSELDSLDDDFSSILCVVRPDGGIHPLCIHEDDNENDLFVHPKLAYLPWTDEEISDDEVQSIYGEGWYGQRVVPSLGGGPGYGAEADDVWTVDEDVLKQVRDDNVIIPILDLGIAHGEKARGGAI